MASANFINECKNYANSNRYGRLTITNTGVELNQSNVIQEFTIDDSCYDNGSILGTVYCKKLNAQLIDALDKTLENASFIAQVGLTYIEEVEDEEQETTEYINLGKYTIEKPKDEQTDNYTSFVAYDDLANKIDKSYVCGLNYATSKTLADLYQDVCINLDLTPKTLSFLNSNISITNNPFKNKETNRFVLETICKIACSFVDIDIENNKIDLVWLNDSLDYTFQKSDYSTLDGGKIVYGPVNSLVIRSASVESENVSQNDPPSIAEYGEHQIVIADDYILNTPQLRQQALSGIWDRVHNLEYVDCELTTLMGKPFLKVGSKIRIYKDDEEYFDTYVLQHEFTFDGAFKSIIKSPAMTQQEVSIKQDISLGEKLNQTVLTVDKQNGVIESVVTETVDTSNPDSIASKQSVLTQRVDSLESAISDIADITISGDTTGTTTIDLSDINQSEPIVINIKPTGPNISYLYPRDNLYPSDTLYMTDRRVIFHNNTTNEDIPYTLPDDLLYYDSDNYDEFMLDYNSQTCKVTKKCKYNADGTVSLLSSPRIDEYEPYPSITLTEGNYSIYLAGYNQYYMFVRLMTSNIYTDQFYTKSQTDTKISQTAQNITLGVNQTLSNYSTTNQMNTAIALSAQDITSTVEDTYETKSNAANTKSQLSTRITQNANSITSEVNRATSSEGSLSTRIGQTAKTIALQVNNGSTSSGITLTTTKENGQTATATGTIQMNGLVSFTNLSTSGQTDINGDNITTGVIKSNNYQANTRGTKIDLSNGAIDSKNFKLDSSGNASFKGTINGGAISVSGDYGENDPYLLVKDSQATGIKEVRAWSSNLVAYDYTMSPEGELARIRTECSDGYAELLGAFAYAFGFENISLAEKKKDFEKLENALDIIKSTDIYKFHYKNERQKKKHIGLVIGDKFNYSKELTNEKNDSVDLYSMIGVCFKAIQEQQEEIEKLKEMIKNG